MPRSPRISTKLFRLDEFVPKKNFQEHVRFKIRFGDSGQQFGKIARDTYGFRSQTAEKKLNVRYNICIYLKYYEPVAVL